MAEAQVRQERCSERSQTPLSDAAAERDKSRVHRHRFHHADRKASMFPDFSRLTQPRLSSRHRYSGGQAKSRGLFLGHRSSASS
jgi:hypothetical protein